MSATTSHEEPAEPTRRGGRAQQVLLIAAMAIGSIAMWAGSPALWIFIASNMSSVSQTAMSSLLVVLIGIPVTMVIIGKYWLSPLDNRYTQLYGKTHGGKGGSAARWLHSARGGGDEDPPTMLDKVMVVSVGIALLLVGIWFAFFSAGSAYRGR